MKGRSCTIIIYGVLLVLSALTVTSAWTPLAVTNDPLVKMPGTQPNQVSLEDPSRCMNCHAGYNTQVEPGFNWKGSMMAQAARDFVFWACLTVAAQDSIHAIGRPNAVDLCERCHFPKGWLEGRSDPPNASAMTGGDYDGIHCDACHRQFDPFFDTTYNGTREGSDWLNYWDEQNRTGTSSQNAADTTYQEDSLQSQTIKLFNGKAFFGTNKRPLSAHYTENGSGQYYISGGNQKRASFADANAKHQILYSRYHKSRYFCNSCHDVSNPALANLSQINTLPGAGTTVLHSEQNSAFSYFHVERTFSEFMLSDYALQGGSAGIGPFAPGQFTTSHSNNYISKCQDCHMRDVVGVGCDKSGVPVRPTGSAEHPNSGQPLHDLTGGNTFVSYVLASSVAGSPNYNATNDNLLRQGPAALTLNLTQGESIDPVALLAGVERAKQQLLLAASIEGLQYNPTTGALSFRVQNQTGHKLISGFPEGRRMFVSIRARRQGNIIYQMNPYDATAGTLKGLNTNYSPSSPPLAYGEAHMDELVYEMHPTSTLTNEAKTFHFVLATGRYKDNRIPPKGFRIADAATRLCEPVWQGVSTPSYFSPTEYAGGYDQVSMTIPTGADSVEVSLYYQSTSREYMEFLRDEINGTGRRTLPDSAYIAQTDPFFAKLKAWGNTIWQLWMNNKDLPGVAPFLMAQSTINVDVPPTPAAPVLQYIEPGDGQVTLNWSSVHSSDPAIVGYRIYLDQAGKSQLVDQVGLTTTYTNTGLTVGQLYCYKVTALYSDSESDYSNVLCAVPAPRRTVGEAKMMQDGSWAYLDDAIVTADQSLGWGYVFVESPTRASGIKLATTQALNLGQRVRLSGVLSRIDGEWQLGDVHLLSATPGAPLEALGMTTRALSNNINGTLDYAGINTVGLLVRAWGRVTSVVAGGRIIYVDDGTGARNALGTHTGIRAQLPLDVDLPAEGSYVSITGISRVEKHPLSDWTQIGGEWYPPGSEVYVTSVWIRDANDITVY